MVTDYAYYYKECRKVLNVRLEVWALSLRQWGAMEGFVAGSRHPQDFKGFSAHGGRREVSRAGNPAVRSCCAWTGVAQGLIGHSLLYLRTINKPRGFSYL